MIFAAWLKNTNEIVTTTPSGPEGSRPRRARDARIQTHLRSMLARNVQSGLSIAMEIGEFYKLITDAPELTLPLLAGMAAITLI